MRILIHDYAGHPYAVQLSRALARRGHRVHHVYSSSNPMPQGSLKPGAGDSESLTIKGIELAEKIQKARFVKRRSQEIEHGRKVGLEIAEFKPDAVLSGSSPLDAQNHVWRVCSKLRIPAVFWLQDVTGVATDVLLRKRLPVAGAAIGRHYIQMEERLLRESAGVVAITSDFVPLLQEAGVQRDRIHVIENWGPIEEYPVCDRQNHWSEAKGYSNSFNFIYSGTLGMKHNPQLLLDLAKAMEAHPEVRVIVVTEGVARPWLEAGIAKMGLKNVDTLDFQPYADVPAMMGAADVLVAILEPAAGIYSVPSKVLSYLCAQRPLLLAVPPENLAAQIVGSARAGLCSSPTDSAKLIENAKALYRDREMRENFGRNGRCYAEATFDIERVAARFEAMFEAAVNRQSP